MPVTGTYTDARDGKVYKTVLMPDGKWWAAENLAWAGAGYDYANNPANRAVYGRLYDRRTASTVVPSGCHLPTYAEWGMITSISGPTLRDGSAGWTTLNGTNETKFSLRGSGLGQLIDSGGPYFSNLNSYGYWAAVGNYYAYMQNSGSLAAAPTTSDDALAVRFIVDSGNVPDYVTPVFGFEPDWSRPVRESIQYMTQVLTARTGMEQRYRLRHVPRRGLAFDLLNIGQAEVQRFASLVWDSQSDLFACPWWPDKIQYAGTLASGATVVTIATTDRLFPVSPMAVIWESPTKCEAVTISSATGTQINISATTQAYTNPLILPAFQGRLDSIDASVLGLKASSASVKIQCEVSPTDTRPSPGTPTQAYGLDVLTAEPNADGQRWASSRIVDRLDNGFGKVAVVDRGGVSFQSTDFNWFVNGRTEAKAYRDFIDRRAGRLVPFWVPTWREDLTLTQQAASGSQAILVQNCGYTTRMYPDVSRRYLAIRTPTNGWIYRKVTSSADTGATETITLDATHGVTLPAGTIVSFLTLCRLADDAAEIDWETPIFGQATTRHMELPKEVV